MTTPSKHSHDLGKIKHGKHNLHFTPEPVHSPTGKVSSHTKQRSLRTLHRSMASAARVGLGLPLNPRHRALRLGNEIDSPLLMPAHATRAFIGCSSSSCCPSCHRLTSTMQCRPLAGQTKDKGSLRLKRETVDRHRRRQSHGGYTKYKEAMHNLLRAPRHQIRWLQNSEGPYCQTHTQYPAITSLENKIIHKDQSSSPHSSKVETSHRKAVLAQNR